MSACVLTLAEVLFKRTRLLELGCSAEQLDAEDAEINARIDAAVTAARADGLPEFQAALADVYTPENTR